MSQLPYQQIHPVDALVSLWNHRDRFAFLLSDKRPHIAPVPPDFTFTTTLWCTIKQPRVLVTIGLSVIALYIFYPAISASRKDKMFSTKRPDKYTTGLINPSIDCFANSNVQALSSLPALNLYLDTLMMIHSQLCQLNSETLMADQVPAIPLHQALIQILSKMQDTIYTTRVVSVWDFLHVLEDIYDARISRSQHDAHELLQLILETLLKEFVALRKTYRSSIPFQESLAREGIKEFPDFPFGSEVASNLRCMRCGKTSSTNYNPMMILSLALPEEASVSLENLLKRNESEVIEDYSCLVCEVKHILASKDQIVHEAKDLKLVERLRLLLERNLILINDDLEPELQQFVDNYPGIKSFKVKSIVHREVSIIKPPKILTIHLSRSIFQDTQAWRNSCDVVFDEELQVKVDNKQFDEFKRKQEVESVDSTGSAIEEMSINPSYNPTLTSLSKASTEHFEEATEDLSDSDFESDDDEDDDEMESGIEEYDEDDAENLDLDKITPQADGSVKRRHEVNRHHKNHRPHGSTPTSASASTESSAFLSITSSFTCFTYEIRSMIRHLGSHSMGHYECYRRKPVYYKSRITGEYYSKFPGLKNSNREKKTDVMAALNNLELSSSSFTETGTGTGTTDEFTGMSDLSTTDMGNQSDVPKAVPASSSVNEQNPTISARKPSRTLSISKFRSRVSSFVGVGPSRQRSLSTTSNGGPVGSLAGTSPSTSQIGPVPFRDPFTKPKRPKKDKKLASSIKHPFWRISDDKVKESTISDVLGDHAAVYMLFYERKDPLRIFQ
ncbi:hypothetical protein FOA43_000512 [Brettanomyces nanus]|uniref:USP domain-containing protein n=1 Tax=Eeniella nana TaxID=13502 RepID=A0A875RYS2_EENNA|nr:uncharacterized protein FOA43_000512 [Brettanomyces nanus]QPG73205.1 hypothetical protein FOA43_000512 [Brettanomyces nanus]